MRGDQMVEELLARAGMLMEDASARLILSDDDLPTRLAVLRDAVQELDAISNEVRQMTGHGTTERN